MAIYGRVECQLLQGLLRYTRVSPVARYFTLLGASQVEVEEVREGELLRLFTLLDFKTVPAIARVTAIWRPSQGVDWRVQGPAKTIPRMAREMDSVLRSHRGSEAYVGRFYPLVTGGGCVLAGIRLRPRRRVSGDGQGELTSTPA